MSKEIKKRTLNELRQSRPFGYRHGPPRSHYNKMVKNDIVFDSNNIVDLIERFSNDADLGGRIREYYFYLKNSKNNTLL